MSGMTTRSGAQTKAAGQQTSRALRKNPPRSSCPGASKRPADAAPPQVRSSKRLRRQLEPDVSTTPASADEAFLAKAKEELEGLNLPAGSNRRNAVQAALRHLDVLRPVKQMAASSARPVAHFLTSREARKFVASTERIEAPIFVADSSPLAFLDDSPPPPSPDEPAPSSATSTSYPRPIEQLLDWFSDLGEMHQSPDGAPRKGGTGKDCSVADIKDAFLKHNGWVKYPMNFPDIACPVPGAQIPDWLLTPSCCFLKDLMRISLDVSAEDVAKAAELDENGDYLHVVGDDRKPLPSAREHAELSMGWRHWETTAMLAESGAITLPHWDKFGFSTWMRCIEGEVGFAYLSHPNDEERRAWMGNTTRPQGTWLFKVLRAGDAMYMPSGTVHMIIRRPHGGQTAGFAGHVLRRCDIDIWLRMLVCELEWDVKTGAADDDASPPYLDLLPQMCLATAYSLRHVTDDESMRPYGGRDRYVDARRRLVEIRRLLGELVERDLGP